MVKLLKINLGQFDEGDSFITDTGDLDVEGIINQFAAEQDETEEEVETEEEIETETETEEEQEEQEEIETEEEEEEVPEKRTADQAFAELRRRAEQSEPLAKWVQDLAKQQGFSDPQELIDAYEQQRIAREAEEKGVPVDVYQRLFNLEQENKRKDDELFAQRFNTEVDNAVSKYKLTENQVTEVFQYMGKNGYIDENGRALINFEDAYILANRETLISDAEERGRQAYLEEKRKQQKQATPKVSTHAKDQKQFSDGLDYSTEGILNKFAELDIPID